MPNLILLSIVLLIIVQIVILCVLIHFLKKFALSYNNSLSEISNVIGLLDRQEKDSAKITTQKTGANKTKPQRKLDYSETFVSVCRIKKSKKLSILIDEVDRDFSKMVNPEGRIIILSNDLFDEVEEEKLEDLIRSNRLTENQIRALEHINTEPDGSFTVGPGGRDLGPKGNENLKDYLIPVLQLIYEGYDYKEAFHMVKDHLHVRYNTVSNQCTRSLGLSTAEFVLKAKDRSIIEILKDKYPERVNYIIEELQPGSH